MHALSAGPNYTPKEALPAVQIFLYMNLKKFHNGSLGLWTSELMVEMVQYNTCTYCFPPLATVAYAQSFASLIWQWKCGNDENSAPRYGSVEYLYVRVF